MQAENSAISLGDQISRIQAIDTSASCSRDSASRETGRTKTSLNRQKGAYQMDGLSEEDSPGSPAD